MYAGRDKNTNSQTNSSTKHILNTYEGVMQNKIYCIYIMINIYLVELFVFELVFLSLPSYMNISWHISWVVFYINNNINNILIMIEIVIYNFILVHFNILL